MSACTGEVEYEGVVGNYYSVTVQAPFGVENPSFGWNIVDTPQESRLSFSDLITTPEGEEMTFHPDEAGKYRFELTVLDDRGEAVTSQKYLFVIQDVSSIMTETEITEPDKEVLAPVSIPGTSMAVEPAAEKELRDTLREAYLVVIDEVAEAVEPEQEVRHEKIVRGSQIPKVEGKLTIQISSWPILQEAQKQVEELLALGFDSYIQVAYFEETGEVWYRVRVGSFTNRDAAQRAAKEISEATKLDTWVDNVRQD